MPTWELRAIIYLLGAAAFAFFGLYQRHEGALSERGVWERKEAAARATQELRDKSTAERIASVQASYAAEQAKTAQLTKRISDNATALQNERHRYATLAGLVRVRSDVPAPQTAPTFAGIRAPTGAPAAGDGKPPGPEISAYTVARSAEWEGRAWLALHACIAQYEAARSAK